LEGSVLKLQPKNSANLEIQSMTHNQLTKMFACLPVLVASSVQAAPVPPAPVAEAQLRAINHRHVNALASGDSNYMDSLTATDFLRTATNGDWLDRAQHLDLIRRPLAAGSISYDDVRVRLFGSVALLHGVFESSGDKGNVIRVRYTDVYHWNGTNWRLINAQNTTLREGVSKQQHVGKAPEHVQWRGQDPSGNDLEVLRELNSSYVRAFREADVPWYGAHLSQDYVVVNSDGSLHDRANALAEFARPTFAMYIRSFPVDKVRIRRFDDIALIHAENDFEFKDGRKGINRYTDIWRKREDGRWECVAAHITTHKALA
jgi:hypothetical protein